MISIKINGLEFLSKPSISILEACKNVGITIPRFCYHEILSVSGNCRMCLVEIENIEKPVASCVTEVEENMSIRIDSAFVKKARENVLEALLLNHPLDCPICDQAGECDLQDQTKTFGSSHSRFFFNKKSSEDKYCGPLIKTIMTRCITCTRCVRYAEEIAGVNHFGTLNRGLGTEIGSYVSKMFESEISGNVIDLCPVGALTSKPYAFKARPWELRLSETIDTLDSLGSNIYVNYKESEILRVLPKSNSELNANLISDKVRFSYDANNTNRVVDVYNYEKQKEQFKVVGWKKFFRNIDTLLQTNSVDFLVNQELDLESAISLKKILNQNNNFFKVHDLDSINKNENLYIQSQTNIANVIDNIDDVSVFLGTNLRLESSILNARVRIKHKNSYISSYVLGNNYDSNIMNNFIFVNLKNIIKIFEGHCKFLSPILFNSAKCTIFLGSVLSNRIGNINNILRSVQVLLKNLIFVKVYNSINSEGFKWLNLNKGNVSNNDNFVMNVLPRNNFLVHSLIKNRKNILISTHGSSLASNSEYILPAKTVYEDSFKYLNMEHRIQKTSSVLKNVIEARKTDKILSSIFNFENSIDSSWYNHIEETTRYPEKYDTLKNVKMIKNLNVSFSRQYEYTKVSKYPFKYLIKNFYVSNLFTENSVIMNKCIKEQYTNFNNLI
jgi:NADH-quinone oxidoreductase chain G